MSLMMMVQGQLPAAANADWGHGGQQPTAPGPAAALPVGPARLGHRAAAACGLLRAGLLPGPPGPAPGPALQPVPRRAPPLRGHAPVDRYAQCMSFSFSFLRGKCWARCPFSPSLSSSGPSVPSRAPPKPDPKRARPGHVCAVVLQIASNCDRRTAAFAMIVSSLSVRVSNFICTEFLFEIYCT